MRGGAKSGRGRLERTKERVFFFKKKTLSFVHSPEVHLPPLHLSVCEASPPPAVAFSLSTHTDNPVYVFPLPLTLSARMKHKAGKRK